MILIEQLPPPVRDEDLRGKCADAVVLNWEQRRWTRARLTTRAGREIALALPTGTVLAPGALLHAAAEWFLRVEAAPDRVLALRPRDCEEAVKLAFNIGNLHFPAAWSDGLLLVPDDSAMEHLFARLGARWERREAVFQPFIGAPAAVPAGGAPGHSHAHGPAGAHAHSRG